MQTYSEATVRENQAKVEQIIDSLGLFNLLELVEDVCGEKAEHLRSNWQDENAAKVWEQAASKVRQAMGSKAVRSL